SAVWPVGTAGGRAEVGSCAAGDTTEEFGAEGCGRTTAAGAGAPGGPEAGSAGGAVEGGATDGLGAVVGGAAAGFVRPVEAVRVAWHDCCPAAALACVTLGPRTGRQSYGPLLFTQAMPSLSRSRLCSAVGLAR